MSLIDRLHSKEYHCIRIIPEMLCKMMIFETYFSILSHYYCYHCIIAECSIRFRWCGGRKPQAFPLRQQIIESFLTFLPPGLSVKMQSEFGKGHCYPSYPLTQDSRLFNFNTTKKSKYSKRLQGG